MELTIVPGGKKAKKQDPFIELCDGVIHSSTRIPPRTHVGPVIDRRRRKKLPENVVDIRDRFKR
ncbi:MAG TPA: hypothetical protein VGE59_00965 [Patescibacteria group bacterium]